MNFGFENCGYDFRFSLVMDWHVLVEFHTVVYKTN